METETQTLIKDVLTELELLKSQINEMKSIKVNNDEKEEIIKEKKKEKEIIEEEEKKEVENEEIKDNYCSYSQKTKCPFIHLSNVNAKEDNKNNLFDSYLQNTKCPFLKSSNEENKDNIFGSDLQNTKCPLLQSSDASVKENTNDKFCICDYGSDLQKTKCPFIQLSNVNAKEVIKDNIVGSSLQKTKCPLSTFIQSSNSNIKDCLTYNDLDMVFDFKVDLPPIPKKTNSYYFPAASTINGRQFLSTVLSFLIGFCIGLILLYLVKNYLKIRGYCDVSYTSLVLIYICFYFCYYILFRSIK